MSIKSTLLKIYYLPALPTSQADANQQKIRDIEWNAVKSFIPQGAKFLDVGCGPGLAMRRAMKELNCDCYGVDPAPGINERGRSDTNAVADLKIVQGEAEALPFPDEMFDVVYCSHVLEHVNDEYKSLQEMKRVLKPTGTLILGMPTATMSAISLVTETLFTTHQRFVNVFMRPFITTGRTPFINLFLPPSHSSHRARTILFDLKYYRVSNWEKIVSRVFVIKQIILPALYPYPQYRQLFKVKVNAKRSSSVFFIGKKNAD